MAVFVANSRLADLKTVGSERVHTGGSFGMGVLNTDATYTLAIAAGTDIVVTSDSAETDGNKLDFQATEDGRTLSMATATGDATFDSIVRVAEDGWVLTLVSGNGAGEGFNLYEDSVNKVLTLQYEEGVSDFDDFETAIGTTTNFTIHTGTTAGGTALVAASHLVYSQPFSLPAWAEAIGDGGVTPFKTTLHFTDGVTTGLDGVAAINNVGGGDKTMTASGGDANTMASADAVAKQDLSGGVDAVAISNIRGNPNDAWVPTKISTGLYRVTFRDEFPSDVMFQATLQLATAADQFAMVSTRTAASKTLDIKIWDKSGAAVADPAVDANNRINFRAVFANTQLG
jgi:hypothetical protein